MQTRKKAGSAASILLFATIMMTTICSEAGFEKIPLYGGQISWIDLCVSNPSTLYAGTSHGGLWISRDTGTTWNETRFWKASNSGASMFAVNPDSAGVIVAFAEQNGRVLRSNDFGESWTEISGFYSVIRTSKMAVDNKSDLLYLAGFTTADSEGVVMTSGDFGKTWKKTSFKSNKRTVADMVITDNGTIAIACPDVKASMFPKMGETANGKIWLSIDSGSSWTEAAGVTVAPWKLSAHKSTIAAVCFGTGFGSGQILISRDNGANFKVLVDSSSIGLNQTSSVEVAPGGDTIFLFGTQGNSTDSYRLRRSIWKDSSWSTFEMISGGALSGDTLINAGRILVDPANPSRMYIADNFEQAFLRSSDHGITWKVSNKGINAVLIYDGTKTPKGSLLALGTGSIFRSDDNAESWQRIFRSTSGGAFGGFDAGVIAAHPDSSLPYLYAVDKSGLLASFDNGSTWKLVLAVPQGWSGSRDIVFLPSNPAVGYAAFGNTSATAGQTGAYLYRTADTGHTWKATSYNGASIQSLALCPWDSTKIWAGIGDIAFWRMKSGAPGGLWEISDADPPVMTQMGLQGKIPYRLAFDKEHPGMVFATAVIDTNTTTGPLFISSDSGKAWDTLTPVKTWDETNKILDMVYSEGTLFFTTFGGIYRYLKSGNTYEQLAASNDIGNASCLIAGSLYAGTSTGMWKYDGKAVHTRKAPERLKSADRITPFVDGRQVRISMQQQGNITLTVTSVNGRMIHSQQHFLTNGTHRIFWNDGKLPSGVYIIKIKTPEISTTAIAVSTR